MDQSPKTRSNTSVITLLKSKTLGHRNHHKNDSPELKNMLGIKNQLILRKGILYRKMKKRNQEGSILEFVVTKDYRTKVLKACHDNVGHAGIWKCTRLLRNRFYWTNINQDMEQHIKRCERCLGFKTKQETAPLENIEASYPMELVHMDYITIDSLHQISSTFCDTFTNSFSGNQNSQG